MLRTWGIVLLVVLSLTPRLWADQPATPVLGGSIDFVGPADKPAYRGSPVLSLDDPLGTVYQAGTTWYDYQHNGTAGKMIGVDNDGWVHVDWMNGLNSSLNPRHVYYNVWNPASQAFDFPGGHAS